ncbi:MULTISPECIES: hypothetical protein [Bacillaceae]|uniref:hypothetical protein n=1 Tax=Bacillaceae TaxID=186817 RepID=UPI000BFE231C|nr:MULTISPECIES: hypothetical protein [Bacillaceae]MCM3164354.1 hypothetical protein [Metabacillus litoralis]PGT85072.1 hypothetical protein COD11_09520 [Bacillus sp. AFS040349]
MKITIPAILIIFFLSASVQNTNTASEPTIIEARVTYGKDNVQDVKVDFEVWEDGEKDHEMINDENKGDGI